MQLVSKTLILQFNQSKLSIYCFQFYQLKKKSKTKKNQKNKMDVSSDSVDAQITRAIEQEWSFLRQKLTKLKTKWLRCGQQVLELKKLISNQYQLLESFSSSVTAAEKSQRVNLLTDKIEQFTSIKNAAELLYEKKSLDVFHLEVVLYTEPRISLLPTDQNEQGFLLTFFF